MKTKSLKRLMLEDELLAKIQSIVSSKRTAIRQELKSRLDFSQFNDAARMNTLLGKTFHFTKRVINGKEMIIAEVKK